jgi:hypothetical protein
MKKIKSKTTTIKKINEILGDKVSEEKKRKLELFLINSSLDNNQKTEVIEFIRSVI